MEPQGTGRFIEGIGRVTGDFYMGSIVRNGTFIPDSIPEVHRKCALSTIPEDAIQTRVSNGTWYQFPSEEVVELKNREIGTQQTDELEEIWAKYMGGLKKIQTNVSSKNVEEEITSLSGLLTFIGKKIDHNQLPAKDQALKAIELAKEYFFELVREQEKITIPNSWYVKNQGTRHKSQSNIDRVISAANNILLKLEG